MINSIFLAALVILTTGLIDSQNVRQTDKDVSHVFIENPTAIGKDLVITTQQLPSTLIQDKDFDTFFKTFINMCFKNNVKEYSKAFYKMNNDKLFNESKLESIKKWTSVDNNGFDKILTEFNDGKTKTKSWSSAEMKANAEGDKELNAIIPNFQESKSVAFNNGSGHASFAKTQGKWYFISGF
jgi:hypothetical protein